MGKKKTEKHTWEYPQVKELCPKTVEGRGTEALAQARERELWFEFGVSFWKSGQPKLKSLPLP